MRSLKQVIGIISAVTLVTACGIGSVFAETVTNDLPSASDTNWVHPDLGNALGTASLSMQTTTHVYDQSDCPAGFTIVPNATMVEKSIKNNKSTFVGNNPAAAVAGNVINWPLVSVPVDTILSFVTYQQRVAPNGTKTWVASVKTKGVYFNFQQVLQTANGTIYAVFPPQIAQDVNWTNYDITICTQNVVSSSSSSSSENSSVSSYSTSSSSVASSYSSYEYPSSSSSSYTSYPSSSSVSSMDSSSISSASSVSSWWSSSSI